MTNQSVVNAIMNNTDGITKTQLSIPSDQGCIHRGKGFELPVTTTTIAGSGVYYVSVKPAANVYVRLRPSSVSSTADIVLYQLYEGATIDAAGDTATPINKNRNSTATSSVTCKTAATTTANGTLIDQAVAGTGGGVQSRSGGSAAGDDNEIVLKPNTQYVVKLTNIGSADTVVYLELFWFEGTVGLVS